MSITVSKLVSTIVKEDGSQPTKCADVNASTDEDHLLAPNELIFCGPVDNFARQTMRLTNRHASKRVAFRLPNNSLMFAAGVPSIGVISPGDSVVVNIELIPRLYVDANVFRKPEIVIEWLPIADAVVSSDGYEDEFIWTPDMVGFQSKTVKLLFKRKAIQVENKRNDLTLQPVSTDKVGSEEEMAAYFEQRFQKLSEEVKNQLARSNPPANCSACKFESCLFTVALFFLAYLVLFILTGLN